jgi:hypothetical protein
MKKILIVSLDEDTIGWINSYKENFRNKSHLVEEALKQFKGKLESNRSLKNE